MEKADSALLDLLWAERKQAASIVASLDERDWARLDGIASQHRLRPLLRHRLIETGTIDRAPRAIADRWRQAYRRASLRALRQRAELGRISRLFAAAGIRGTALKGAGIVWRGWIDPALRPMRDLDILVSEDQATAAYDVLCRQGFSRPDVDAALSDKHLPGLTGPGTRVHVEIHTRLAASRGADWDARESRFRHRALERIATTIPESNACASFTDTDALLHVVAHGALDHQFNNGPLLLVDLALLAEYGAIDWPLFWREAQALDSVRACQLALRLAERYAGASGIGWEDHRPCRLPDAVIEGAAAMMLVDSDRRSELGWAGQLADVKRGGLRHIRAMVGRRWNAIRSEPTRGDRTLFHRLATMVRAAFGYASVLLGRRARRHLRRSVTVITWLNGN